jgi:trans-aconitate methyltransferase
VSFDAGVPNPARIWNYWLGGKDNFAADREAGERVIAGLPNMQKTARWTRRYLVDVVNQMVTVYGVRQFLDIGSGLPTADNTHEIAQRAAPEARIVYVDNDPVVLSHARALLTSGPQGRTDYFLADLRNVATILEEASRTLDFSQPIAVLLIGVLHFIPDDDDPYAIVSRLMDGLPSGSYLVIGHGGSDIEPAAAAEMASQYNARSSVKIRLRNRDEVARFLDGLEPVGRGVVRLDHWWDADPIVADTASALAGYCAVARKP